MSLESGLGDSTVTRLSFSEDQQWIKFYKIQSLLGNYLNLFPAHVP